MAEETKQISATIDITVAEKVEEIAKKDERSFSQTVNRLLKKAIEEIPANNKTKIK